MTLATELPVATMASMTYLEALAAVIERAVWTTRKEVIPASDVLARCSDNAMARNDWTQRDVVRFHPLVTFDGVDVTDDFAFNWASPAKTKKQAQEYADGAKAEMATWDREYLYEDESYGYADGPFVQAIVAVGGPTPTSYQES